jgi:tetratricopeptide (TPR) repeat protein
MKFSQPLVLLLGSVLSASGVGCSAISAIVTDSRPAHRENRKDTDRIAAIGRVFENQGRYDNAEAMYRRALRNRPQDSELNTQLQQLADRRKEQSFGPSGTANAIAVADIVSPPKTNIRPGRGAAQTVEKPALQPSLPIEANETVRDEFETRPQLPDSPSEMATEMRSSVSNAAHSSGSVQHIALASGATDGWRKSQNQVVTSEDVMAALECPDQHVDLLLNALVSADSHETKTLAATLLGDCDPGNLKVREALVEQLRSQSTPEVLIAVCDSQIERNETNGETVSILLCLCSGRDCDAQIQAASQLRNFAGTESETQCTAVLSALLGHAEPTVRATAALTLGDFTSLNSSTIARLQELVNKDASPNVREAAESALSRQQLDSLQIIPTLSITPL